MILSAFSEEQILSELVKDFKQIKRTAKKKADAYLLKAKKSGIFIRETDYEVFLIKTVSNNLWNLEIEYNQTNSVPWLFKACCIVEGDKKTKDYYIVRGVNSNKPYFVKITSHTIKRVRERNKLTKFNIDPETLACMTFEHRETAICMKYIDVVFHKLLQGLDEVEEIDDMSYIVLAHRGIYFAKKTKGGNFIFKTCISPKMGVNEALNFQNSACSKWAKEGELLNTMIYVHMYYNKFLYDKDVLDNILYSVIDRNEEWTLNKNSSIILLKN